MIYYDRSLVHLSKRTTDQASDVPSIIFFHSFLQNSLQNSLQIFFKYFLNFFTIKINNFERPKSIGNHEMNNAWTIRRLVGGSFGQTNKRFIVIYNRLTELKYQRGLR